MPTEPTPGAIIGAAAGANATHGRPRSAHEREMAIQLAVQGFQEKGEEWTNTKIAEVAKVSHQAVGRYLERSNGQSQEGRSARSTGGQQAAKTKAAQSGLTQPSETLESEAEETERLTEREAPESYEGLPRPPLIHDTEIGKALMSGGLGATTMATNSHTAPDNGELTEEPTDPRTIQELIDAGYVGFLAGSDGAAIVDPILPDDPEEADKLKWRFDF